MGRISTTHFNPSLGVKYYVFDTVKNEKILGRVLGPNDKKYLPVRSSRKTNPGEEFFKMIIDGQVHKFLNSNLFPDCRSEDKRYIFLGEKAESNRRKNKEEKKENQDYILEWEDEEVKHFI